MNLDDLPNPSGPVLTYSMAAEAQASVDEEITRRILILCDLRTRRNSFSPVFRLAPETLGLVFIHSARDHYENEKSTRHSAPPIPGWVNVSYVCRHWRNAALKCPTLWSYHFIVSPRWTDELLARSKQVSLKTRVFYYEGRGDQWWLDLMAKLMNHVERIQELQLSFPARLLPTTSLHALRLENLEITATTNHFIADQSVALFDGQTPVLRTLKVSGHGVSLGPLTLGSLTTLSLCRVPHQLRHNMREFLVMLSRMQGLTYLYLEDCLVGALGLISGDVSNVPPKITLPRLAHLLVAAPHSTVVAFLSCVTIPLNTKVKLHFQSEHGSSVDFAPISQFLAQRTTESEVLASPDSSIRLLVIDHGSDQVNFIFSTLERGFDAYSRKISALGWDCDNPLVVGVAMRDITVDILNVMCCSIASKDIRSLHIIKPPSSYTFWRTTLSHFRDLRYIKLSQGMMPDGFELFITANRPVEDLDGHITDDEDLDEHTTDDGEPNNMLVPALEELELDNIQFWHERNVRPPAEVQSLCTALSSRKQSRGKLTIFACEIRGHRRLWSFEMVGQWAGGCFDTREEDYYSCHPPSDYEDSEDEGSFTTYW